MYVTLEIRRLYHGPILTSGETGDAEQYTYSVAWLAFGVVLLGIGVMFNSQRARLASAMVIALTILKAFLIDMSTLTGAYRALSFMCLGLVLVAIGWTLYQRILFSRRAMPPVPSCRRRRATRRRKQDPRLSKRWECRYRPPRNRELPATPDQHPVGRYHASTSRPDAVHGSHIDGGGSNVIGGRCAALFMSEAFG